MQIQGFTQANKCHVQHSRNYVFAVVSSSLVKKTAALLGKKMKLKCA